MPANHLRLLVEADSKLPCVRATSWLLTDGWTRAGPIYTDEIPGPD